MTIGQKRKDRRHYSYDEGTDEPAGLIDKESTDIETERPIDDTEPVEQVEEEDIAPRYSRNDTKLVFELAVGLM
jgi:hypothetical protein